MFVGQINKHPKAPLMYYISLSNGFHLLWWGYLNIFYYDHTGLFLSDKWNYSLQRNATGYPVFRFKDHYDRFPKGQQLQLFNKISGLL